MVYTINVSFQGYYYVILDCRRRVVVAAAGLFLKLLIVFGEQRR